MNSINPQMSLSRVVDDDHSSVLEPSSFSVSSDEYKVGIQITEQDDDEEIDKADQSMLLYPVKHINRQLSSTYNISEQFLKRIEEKFPGKIRREWESIVVLGHDFNPQDCKITREQRAYQPKSQRFAVYQFKKPTTLDFRVFECLHERDKNDKHAPFPRLKGCHKIYTNLIKFYDHLRTHTGERPFYCCDCDRGFYQEGNLKAHMRQVHEGQRQFICSTCSFRTYRKNNLAQHEATHRK